MAKMIAKICGKVRLVKTASVPQELRAGICAGMITK